jgi:hypothetical protein
MDQKTKTNKAGVMKHPYEQFENSRVWIILNKAIDDLVENQDITETTRRELIVGYLCKKLWPELNVPQNE